MSTPDALETALAAALDAGAMLRAGAGITEERPVGRAQDPDSKQSSIDLVTEFDRRAEAMIGARLRAAFPDDEVLGEEGGASGEQGARARWIIDPLDGTTNFAHGLPFFCVSIAREVDGVVQVGVVHAPALGWTFTGRRGFGAFCNGTRLAVSRTDTLARSILATGFPYDNHTSPDNNFDQFTALHRKVQGIRRVGSAAIDLSLVAAGAFDGYWEMKLRPWDLAAGALFVEEAGGKVTGWSGEPFGPATMDRGALVATNGKVHDEILATLASLPLPQAAR